MKTQIRILAAIALSVLLLVSGESRAQDPVRIIVGGASTVKMLASLQADMEKAAGTRVDITMSPIDIATGALARGVIDGIIGPDLNTTLSLAEKKGLAKQNPNDYQTFPIHKVEIQVAFHPDNKVPPLTHDQIAGILRGKLTSWDAIKGSGSKDPIIVFFAEYYVATNRVLLKHYTDSESSSVPLLVKDKEGLLNALRKHPNAIGIFSAPEEASGFKPRFQPTEASFLSHLTMKKTARAPAQRVFDLLKEKSKTEK